MIEAQQNIQKTLTIPSKKKLKISEKILSIKARRAIPQRLQKQFTNPIYENLDINEGDGQGQNLGPWIITNQIQIKAPKPVPQTPQIAIEEKKEVKKRKSLIDLQNSISPVPSKKEIIRSKSELPIISQKKNKRSLPILRIKEKDEKKLLNFPKKIEKCPCQDRQTISSIFKQVTQPIEREKIIQPPKQRIKLRNVVYNYCTDFHMSIYNTEQTKKKQNEIDTDLMMKLKLTGFKDYWKHRRSSMSNEASTQGSP